MQQAPAAPYAQAWEQAELEEAIQIALALEASQKSFDQEQRFRADYQVGPRV